jgi:putative endonuclease
MTDARRAVGSSGEDAVAAWYAAAGYEVLDRNWRVRTGEIDLVARRGGTVVFCEVKTRRSDRFGLPTEAVDGRKQRRLRGLAVAWLDAHDVTATVLRFDVAAVTPHRHTGWDVDVFEDAF